MIHATVRIYAELNDFLLPRYRQSPFVREIRFPTTVKDLLEGAGVPHPEIALILVDDQPQPFEYLIDRDCRVAAYPRFQTVGSTEITLLQPEVLWEPRFVLDVHLGRLARYLRLLGFDALYDNAADDDALIHRSSHGDRILLTRDRELLMRRQVICGRYIRAEDPRRQLVEVVRRFDLVESAQPFTRCMSCNGLLTNVEKSDVEDQLEPGTRRYFDRFWQCQMCGNIYWEGSHYERLVRRVANSLDCFGSASTSMSNDDSKGAG